MVSRNVKLQKYQTIFNPSSLTPERQVLKWPHKKQECFSVEGQPPTCFDLDLGPVTLIKLELDMVFIYHCAKKKVSIPSASKVTAQTVTRTDKHRHDKNIISNHTQAVIIPIHLNLMVNSTVM